MKISEIRDRTDDELSTLSAQLLDDAYQLSVQKATNQLENTASLKVLRRDLARVKTVRQARIKGVEEPKTAKR